MTQVTRRAWLAMAGATGLALPAGRVFRTRA
jgi:hypothetical protein